MPISVTCPCGQRLNVPDHCVGKQVRCPKCAQALSIGRPQAAQTAAPTKEPEFSFDELPPTANPYRAPINPGAPQRTTPGGGSTDRTQLKAIASAQRQVNLAVLLYLCMVPINLTLSIASEKMQWAGALLAVVVLVVLGFGAVSVYRLAAIFRGKGVAVIYVLALLAPLVGLILLISVSQKATNILQQNGIKVGLLGANPDKI